MGVIKELKATKAKLKALEAKKAAAGPLHTTPKIEAKKWTIFKLISKLLLAAILLAIIWYGFVWLSGWTAQKGFVETGVGLEKTTQQAGGLFGGIWGNFQEWVQGTYGFKKPKVEEKEPSGIKIKSFTAGSSYFRSGEPIVLRAEIQADALAKQDTRVEFYCDMDDKTAEAEISGGVGNYVVIQAGRSRILPVVCKFEGLEVETDTTKKVKLTARYNNFITRDTLKVYTLADETYASVGTEDPFDFFGVDEDLLSKGVMRPQCVSGCGLTKLSVKTSSQPLTETQKGANYFLDIKLQDDKDWHGDIDAVNYIKVLKHPDNVDIVSCSPEITTDSQSGDVQRLNKALEEGELSFSCEFSVSNADQRLGENIGQFIVEAQYIYDVEDKTTINIKKSKEIVKPKDNSNSITTNSFIVSGILEEALQ